MTVTRLAVSTDNLDQTCAPLAAMGYLLTNVERMHIATSEWKVAKRIADRLQRINKDSTPAARRPYLIAALWNHRQAQAWEPGTRAIHKQAGDKPHRLGGSA